MTRPKRPGLWLRLTLRGGAVIEGVYPSFDILPIGGSVTVHVAEKRQTFQLSDLEDIAVIGVIGGGQNPQKRKRKTK